MPRHPDLVAALDASRRVGWARYYQEREVAERLEDRLRTLVPAILDLVDAVLYEKNCDAFARAYRLDQLVQRVIGPRPNS